MGWKHNVAVKTSLISIAWGSRAAFTFKEREQTQEPQGIPGTARNETWLVMQKPEVFKKYRPLMCWRTRMERHYKDRKY